MTALRPVTHDVGIAVSGGFTRPPMERAPGVAKLFEQAQRIGRNLGIELSEGSTGGGSDGNFTAASGSRRSTAWECTAAEGTPTTNIS